MTVKKYFASLSTQQKANITEIIAVLRAGGITNKFTLAGILSVLSKESGFIPVEEKGYGNTSVERIKQIFRGKVAKYTDEELEVLKKDDFKFFNILYGGLGGNLPTEGYKYRGRGLNQITFKNTYRTTGEDIGVDLVKYPEKLLELDTASSALVSFYKRSFSKTSADFRKQYRTTDINGFSSLEDAVNACYHINAGLGRTFEYIQTDHTGGRKKSLGRASGFLEMVK